jgi:hypothetical protein
MNIQVKRSILALAIFGALISGCGNSNSDSSTSQNSGASSSSGQTPSTSENTITVVDGYIVNAIVKNGASTILGSTDIHGKVYINDDNELVYPLHAIGGFIDIDANGKYEEGVDFRIPQDLEFIAQEGYVISPLTTLVAMGANKEKLAMLAGISPEDIFSDPIKSGNVNLEKMNQIAYVLLASRSAQNFIYYVNNLGEGDLPTFGEGTNLEGKVGSLQAFADLAFKATERNDVAQNLIAQILSLEVEDPKLIEEDVKSLKEQLKPTPTPSGDTGGGLIGGGTTTPAASSASQSVSSVLSSSFSSSTAGSNTSDLPNLSNYDNIIQPASSQPSDLPNFQATSSTSTSSSLSSSSSSVSSSNTQDVPNFSYE